MNFKVLSVATLMISSLCFSTSSIAEKMPETPKHKSERIKKDVNQIFQHAFRRAATELDAMQQVMPFAVIQKKDGRLGVFRIDDTEKDADLTVDEQAASIRKNLIGLVVADQIDASLQVMYAAVQQEGKTPRQGLIFEIEHIDGVSLLRFLPISKIRDDKGAETGKLLFDMESLTTTIKPKTVFAFAKAS